MANENNQAAQVGQSLLGANEKGQIIYSVNGEDVKLSLNIVRNFLTRGTAGVTDAEIVQFIWLCRANSLNPFVGDAYMVKYQPRDEGRAPEPAQMIISKGAFMKRAEASSLYKGYRAGVILLRKGQVVEEEGSFFMPGDELIGGWAKVFRSDREMPVVARVRLEEYNSRKSTWAAKPATMIRKVAIAQAFREAFPLTANGMYTPEEMPDEQSGEQQKQLENSETPVFIDRQPEDFHPDPEPAEFTPDPEPVEMPAMQQEPEGAAAAEEDKNLELFRV